MKSAPQWKTTSLNMVDDFQSHLAASAPKRAKLRLEEFRQRLARARNRREATAIEAELERLLQSQPYYRAAARRSIQAGLRAAISSLQALLSLARRYNEIRRNGGPTGKVNA